jgi:hypothetical protein
VVIQSQALAAKSDMALQKGTSSPRPNEATPLLRSIDQDDGSSDTLTDSRRGDEEEVEDGDKANQHVGRVRGLFIMLSLCGLMFLQGKSCNWRIWKMIYQTGLVLIASLAASNLSLVTTTQSKIAEDLDAFVAASWFTSAYMVSPHLF